MSLQTFVCFVHPHKAAKEWFWRHQSSGRCVFESLTSALMRVFHYSPRVRSILHWDRPSCQRSSEGRQPIILSPKRRLSPLANHNFTALVLIRSNDKLGTHHTGHIRKISLLEWIRPYIHVGLLLVTLRLSGQGPLWLVICVESRRNPDL